MSDFPSMHSLYGRSLGVTYDGYYTGERGGKDIVTALTSASTGTNIKPYGITTLSVTTGSSDTGASFIMDAPVAGVPVVLANVTTSSTQAITITTTAGTFMTGVHTVMGSSVSFAQVATAGSSYNTLTLNAGGEVVELVGLSTSYYLVRDLSGFSTGDTIFSVT
jgi:hypothetical protein